MKDYQGERVPYLKMKGNTRNQALLLIGRTELNNPTRGTVVNFFVALLVSLIASNLHTPFTSHSHSFAVVITIVF